MDTPHDTASTHLSSHFVLLDALLDGGYPCGTMTALEGFTHGAKSLLMYAHASAKARGWKVGYLRTDRYKGVALRTATFWADAAELLLRGVELLLLDGVSATQWRAMPKGIPGVLSGRGSTLIVALKEPLQESAQVTVRLALESAGWIYRHQRACTYRLMVTRLPTAARPFPPEGVTLVMPFPPKAPPLPLPDRIRR